MTPTLPLPTNSWPWPSATRAFSVTLSDGRTIVVWALTTAEARRIIEDHYTETITDIHEAQ